MIMKVSGQDGVGDNFNGKDQRSDTSQWLLSQPFKNYYRNRNEETVSREKFFHLMKAIDRGKSSSFHERNRVVELEFAGQNQDY